MLVSRLGQADQKTDDMLACVAGYGGGEVLLALWLVHTNTKYTETQDKYPHQQGYIVCLIRARSWCYARPPRILVIQI